MKRLVIADVKSPTLQGNTTGHFFALAENYYALFHNHVPTRIAGGPIYSNLSQEEQIRLPFNIELSEKNKFVQLYRYLSNAKSLFQQCEGDTIIVQQGSDATFFAACTLFCRRKRNKIYLIQYSKASLRGILKKILFRLASAKIDGIICPSEEVGNAFKRPYCVVPDYIYQPQCFPLETLAYDQKQYDICFLGRIVEEKGICEFIEQYADTSYKMIVAGRPATEALGDRLTALACNHANITLRLEFIPHEEYENYLRQSRFCVLNYQGEYSNRSSGVVLDMLFHNVPVIGLRCKALNFVEKYGLGYIYDDLLSLDLKTVITEGMHGIYVRNIAEYKKTHVEYRKKLFDFLNISHNDAIMP